MFEFLSPDSRLMQFLSRVADLMILNFLTILCCIPIITVGAALTALHTIMIKIVRGEESYMIKPYFKAFKESFKQATLIWLFMLLVFILFGSGVYVSNFVLTGFPIVLKVVQVFTLYILLLIFVYVFPTIARFNNSFGRTLTNCLMLAVGYFPRTMAMVLVNVLAAVSVWLFPQAFPIYLCFCFSFPAFLCAKLYNPIFEKLEGKTEQEEEEPDSWTVPLEEGLPGSENESLPLNSDASPAIGENESAGGPQPGLNER